MTTNACGVGRDGKSENLSDFETFDFFLFGFGDFGIGGFVVSLVDLRVSGCVILGLGLSAFGLGQGYRPLKSLCLCHCRLGGIGLCHCRRGGKDFVTLTLSLSAWR